MNLNEVKYSALLDQTGATPPITINELEILWLDGLGYTVGTLNERYHLLFDGSNVPDGSFNERYYTFLTDLGFTGTLNEMLYAFWAGGGTIGENLYPNPELAGGSDIVADVFTTLPDNHVAVFAASNPADATYFGPANPAYTFVSTGDSRFMLGCNVNTVTSLGVTLPSGRRYRFSATVQAVGQEPAATRLINVAALTNGAVVTNGPSYVPDGTLQRVFIDFEIPADESTCQLRHGIGAFNAVTNVGATQETRDLKLVDIGPIPIPFNSDYTMGVGRSGGLFGYRINQFGTLSPDTTLRGDLITRFTVRNSNGNVRLRVNGIYAQTAFERLEIGGNAPLLSADATFSNPAGDTVWLWTGTGSALADGEVITVRFF